MGKVTIYTEDQKKDDLSLGDIYGQLLDLGMVFFRTSNSYDDKNVYARFTIHGATVSIEAPYDNVRYFKETLNEVLEKRLKFER